jgi:hypothetical protein
MRFVVKVVYAIASLLWALIMLLAFAVGSETGRLGQHSGVATWAAFVIATFGPILLVGLSGAWLISPSKSKKPPTPLGEVPARERLCP